MSGEQLLIVDRNRSAALALAELLSAEGYAVQVADGADDALQLAQENQPSVVFAERWCGGVDAFQLIRQMRRSSGGPVGVILTTTDWGPPPSSRRGHFFYLTKPLDFEAVAQVTCQALGHRFDPVPECVMSPPPSSPPPPR